MMAELTLVPHPGTPCPWLAAVRVQLDRLPGGGLELHYTVTGDVGMLSVPELAPRGRTAGLWNHTCFEMFIAPAGAADYREFNFSPSQQWAAWRFDARRTGMRDESLLRDPLVNVTRTSHELRCDVRLEGVLGTAAARAAPGRHRIALCAVIEDLQGRMYYWALRHPSGPPDFHHPEGFALEFEDAA